MAWFTVVGDGQSAVLTDERLMSDNLPARTLTAKGGLFYAGQLSAVRPPDLYSILLDGERASRPNICSREEVLQETVRFQRTGLSSEVGSVCKRFSATRFWNGNTCFEVCRA